MMHIDIRGPHPILVSGFICIELTNKPRDITVAEAINWLASPARDYEKLNLLYPAQFVDMDLEGFLKRWGPD